MSSRIAILLAVCLICPRVASAQWYVAAYLGANHTLSAPVSIDQPDLGTSLEFEDVTFEARPFESPQYYGVRAGRFFGAERRFGVEFEWFHPKVYAETNKPVHITGRYAGATIDTTAPMDTIVQRYSMSHGMNFMLINAVMRLPISDATSGLASRVALIGRAGAGPMLPHGESQVAGTVVEQYEIAGVGYQVAGGADVRLAGRLSATVEYKFGHASPEITIDRGTGHTTANLHQIAFGIAVGVAR